MLRLLLISSCFMIPTVASHAAPPPKPLHAIRLTKGKEPIQCAAFFPDGKTLVLGGGYFAGPGELLFWDLKTGKPLHSRFEHKFAVSSVAVHPKGTLVASGGGHGEVKLWDPKGKVVGSVSGKAEYTHSILFAPDGKWFAHTGWDLVVRDTAKFAEIGKETKEAPKIGNTLSLSADGKTVVGAVIEELVFRSVPEGRRIASYRSKVRGQKYFCPRYSPDGKSLVVMGVTRGGEDAPDVRVAEMWSIEGTKLGRKRFEVPGHFCGVGFTPDGKRVLLGEMVGPDPEKGGPYRIRVFDVGTGKEVVSWVAATEECIRELVISPDGRLVVNFDYDVAKVWDLERILSGK
jgi:WD40 repeat protein